MGIFLVMSSTGNKIFFRLALVIPPFLGQKGKFTEAEVMKTHEIARLRIHVERAIHRIKEYHIFDGVVPLNVALSINQYLTVLFLQISKVLCFNKQS